MRQLHKLSALAVKNMTKPGLHGDGGGLYLQVSPGGARSWIFRYMLDGVPRKMGLGPLPDISLAMAREAAVAARDKLRNGIDPIDERNDRRAARLLEKAKEMTFRQCGEAYISAHSDSWRNEKHRAQWSQTLNTYAYPTIGDLPVASITTDLVFKVLDPIWRSKAETASRLRGRLEVILDWATVRQFRKGENPARWRGHLESLLPPRHKVAKVVHQPAMAYTDVPAFMAKLRQKPEVSARGLEFAILCAARTGEVLGARWAEIDIEAKVWTVPAQRMKAGREHRVPLSTRAVEILTALPRRGDIVFAGRANAPLSNMALLMMTRGMVDQRLTVHGFRSSFRDWAGEATNFQREVAEAALAHVIGDQAEQAYRRGDALEKRRKLMQAWAEYCERPPAENSAKVVAIGAAR